MPGVDLTAELEGVKENICQLFVAVPLDVTGRSATGLVMPQGKMLRPRVLLCVGYALGGGAERSLLSALQPSSYYIGLLSSTMM
ncbi:MAG: hypothetical protein DDT20_01353 [Firmicutes bacterium]|nr:hypothetical protein [Bacillota bacterium]